MAVDLHHQALGLLANPARPSFMASASTGGAIRTLGARLDHFRFFGGNQRHMRRGIQREETGVKR